MKTFIKILILLFAINFSGCWNMYNDANDDLENEYKFFLAVIDNSSPGSVSTFSFSPDNKLNVSSKKTATDNLDRPTFAAAHPTGKYLYVPNHGDLIDTIGSGTNLSMFIVSNDGSLSPLLNPLSASNTIDTGTGPYAVKVHPSGNYAYVTNGGSADISMYQINSDGSLATNGTISAGNCPRGLAIDPSGKYLYAVNYNDHSISMYSITNGLLTALPASPLSLGATYYPRDIIVHPNNLYAYATADPDYIFIFSINSSNGTLVSSGSIAITAPNNPYTIAIHPSGQYIYIANYNTVDAFSVSATDGSLSFLNRINDTSEIGGSTCGIVIDPDGRYLYTSAWGSVVVAFIGLLGNGELDLNNYQGYWPSSGVPNGSPVGLTIIRKKIK